jgi:hypothetical protein
MNDFSIRNAMAGAMLAAILAAFLAGIGPAQAGKATAHFREGDIIFQSSASAQGKAVELATHSLYSHCGIVLKIEGEFHVYEAVGPVRHTPLKAWIAQGKDGHYALKRLKDAEKILTQEALDRLKKLGNTFAGKPYDFAFGWSDDRIYCSELVYKIYQRALGLELGKIRRLGDFDLNHSLVQEKLRERYGGNVPLDEPVVSPQDIFESALLVSAES